MGRFINNENSIFQKWAEKIFQPKIFKIQVGTLSSSEASQTFTLPQAIGCVCLGVAFGGGTNQIIQHSTNVKVIAFRNDTGVLTIERVAASLYTGQIVYAWFARP